jgi:ParB family chromosome partitioning protein
MKTHHLKTWPEYFEAIWRGDKTFEFRLNDRDFKEGDKLILEECSFEGVYSGRSIECNAGYILYSENFGILPIGYCIMSIGNCVQYME